ncbi:MAG: hypothetical protein KAR13_13355, partial [Desulfobulbaceae bacterium]|nr:hypothetical protein [Desulfobulbaceae bacterium]
EHCYAVTAIDAVGNESEPSGSFYLNFELLPVNSLLVRQIDNESPVISWTHANINMAGYDFYLGDAKLNESLITEFSYTDIGYTFDERHYNVIAVDDNGVESLGRGIMLPVMDAAFVDGTVVKRGFMNRLEYLVENHSVNLVENVHLTVELEGMLHVSQTFSVKAEESVHIPVTVGGYSNLPDVASLDTTIEIQPNPGERIQIVRTGEIEIYDGMLNLGIFNREFLRGGIGSVYFTLENTGAEEIEIVTANQSGLLPSNEIKLYLLDEDGNVLSSAACQQSVGSYVITLPNNRTVARIPAGETFSSQDFDIQIPANAPDEIVLLLEISQVHFNLGKVSEVSMQGMQSRQRVSLVDTFYYGEVLNVSPDVSLGDDEIIINGRAVERETGESLKDVTLDLIIEVHGFERKYKVFTDSTGHFSYTFTPLTGESGVYTFRAIHPDLTDTSPQGQFVIRKVAVLPEIINLNIPRNYEQKIDIQVKTGEGTALNNLQLIYAAEDQHDGIFPEGIHVSLENNVSFVGANQSVALRFTIWADNNAPENETLVFKVKSDEPGEGEWGTILLQFHLATSEPALFFTPDHIQTGMAYDDIVSETITLGNRGLSCLNNVSVSLHSQDGSPAPAWVALRSLADVGDIQVGDKRNVIISFSPTSALVTEGFHVFSLKVSSSNYPTININLYASVTQSGYGDVLFKVEDIYTATLDKNGDLIQGLSGARV